MKKLTEGEVRLKAKQKAFEAGDVDRVRDKSLYRRFLLLVEPRRGKPYGVECSEREYERLCRKAKKVAILWQSRVMKAAGEKSFTRDLIPTNSSARKAFHTDHRME